MSHDACAMTVWIFFGDHFFFSFAVDRISTRFSTSCGCLCKSPQHRSQVDVHMYLDRTLVATQVLHHSSTGLWAITAGNSESSFMKRSRHLLQLDGWMEAAALGDLRQVEHTIAATASEGLK